MPEPRKKKRTHQVKINLTDDEMNVVEEAAAKELRSVNAFVRVVVLVAASRKTKKQLIRGNVLSGKIAAGAA
jgi:uncharacterized protein (DUF1778 family)